MNSRIQPFDPFPLQHATSVAIIALLMLAANAPPPNRRRIIPPRQLRAHPQRRRDRRGKGQFSS